MTSHLLQAARRRAQILPRQRQQQFQPPPPGRHPDQPHPAHALRVGVSDRPQLRTLNAQFGEHLVQLLCFGARLPPARLIVRPRQPQPSVRGQVFQVPDEVAIRVQQPTNSLGQQVAGRDSFEDMPSARYHRPGLTPTGPPHGPPRMRGGPVSSSLVPAHGRGGPGRAHHKTPGPRARPAWEGRG